MKMKINTKLNEEQQNFTDLKQKRRIEEAKKQQSFLC